MEVDLAIFASVVDHLRVVCCPPHVDALEFGYCGETETCECTSEDADNSDACYNFDISEIVDPDDPADVREAYNVETTWDSEAGLYHVTAETTTARTHVMGIISHRGDWGSVDNYTQYVNTLLGISDTPIAWSGPDRCNPVPPMTMSFSGDYGRWDAENSQWTGSVRSNLLIDAISGPNLEFDIDRHVELDLSAPKCAQSSSSDGKLEAEQCSTVGMNKDHTEPAECESDSNHDLSVIPIAKTYINKLSWDNQTSELTTNATTFKINKVKAEEINLGAYYYNGNGKREGVGYTQYLGPVGKLIVGANVHALRTQGTCGYGYVKRSTKRTPRVRTKAGSANKITTGELDCPSAPTN